MSEAGIWRGDTLVARESEIESAADAITADCRDDRLLESSDAVHR